MENENNQAEEIQEDAELGEEIRMSGFSMVISIVFVTIVMIFLYVKIMFD